MACDICNRPDTVYSHNEINIDYKKLYENLRLKQQIIREENSNAR